MIMNIMLDKLYKSNYKGKWFVIQDELYELDFSDGMITRSEALDKQFIKFHKANCRHYGIPAYLGDDKELKKIYK